MAATVAAILLLAGGARAARPALTLEKQPLVFSIPVS